MIFQYNKRDVSGAVDPKKLDALLGASGAQVLTAVASEGTGVLETLKAAVGAVVAEISNIQKEALPT